MTADVSDVLAPVLPPLGLVLEDVSVAQAGRRRLVRVLVDRQLEAGGESSEVVPPLSLDEVAEASRAIDDALEASDVLGSAPYTLEVSSPGVSRPLTQARHFRRNVGRLIEARRHDGDSVSGRIASAGPDSITLTLDDPNATLRLSLDDIAEAIVQVEFNRPSPEEN